MKLNIILDQRDIALAILKQEVITKAISKGNKRVRRNGVTVQQLNKLDTIIKKLHKLSVEVSLDTNNLHVIKEVDFLENIFDQLEDFKNEQIKGNR